MTSAIENLKEAMTRAMAIRPASGGFPVLAEVLRQAGVTKNTWYLPSCQSVYLTKLGPVINQSVPLRQGMIEVPKFDEITLIRALRTDQAGKSTFPEFLEATWLAGVISYDVDFEKRQCVYRGAVGETYVENYASVEI